MTAVSILVSLALGWLLVRRFAGLDNWLLVFGAGTAVGIGITSCLYFVPWFIRAAACAALGYDCWRRRPRRPAQKAPRFAYTLILAAALLVAVLLVTLAMSAAWEANPQGNWDAWAVWNLRAKFLAAPGVAARAWSPMLNATHPEYPLLLSGFVAACWRDAGTASDLAPIATSYLFFLALLAIVTGAIGVLRGPVSGLLAGLCLLGIPALLTEVPAQYADVPLACYMAGALLFVLLDRPVLAGAMAGMAAWTKDEGLLFLAVAAIAVALARRRTLLRFALGAAPAAAIALIFKFAVAHGTHSVVAVQQSSMGSRLADASRYAATASAMAREILHWNIGWYHPLLPVAVLAAALRFDRRQARPALFSAAVAAALLAGYFGVYVITPNDLQWQLQTSLTRLLVQASPLVLISVFIGLRAPEPALTVEAKSKPEPRKKSRR